jgi:hypothetical protein
VYALPHPVFTVIGNNSQVLTTPTPHASALRRVTLVALITLAAGVLAAGQTEQVVARVALAIALIASARLYRIAVRQIAREGEHAREVETAARLDGIASAANVMREQVANKLGVVIGYSEALAEDEDQPTVVRQRAHRMLASALEAADVLHTLESRVTSSGDA